MRFYDRWITRFALWLLDTFETRQFVTYSVTPGRLHRPLKKESEIRRRAMEAWSKPSESLKENARQLRSLK